MKMTAMQPCPRCGSLKTGKIEACRYGSFTQEVSDRKRALKAGHLVKYVEPQMYRTYYLPQNITGFCRECDYEFCGKTEVLHIKDSNAVSKYREQHGLEEELLSFHKRKNLPSRLFIRIKMYWESKKIRFKPFLSESLNKKES